MFPRITSRGPVRRVAGVRQVLAERDRAAPVRPVVFDGIDEAPYQVQAEAAGTALLDRHLNRVTDTCNWNDGANTFVTPGNEAYIGGAGTTYGQCGQSLLLLISK